MLAQAAIADNLTKNKYFPIVAGVLIIGIVGIAYFGVARPIMCKVGVMECRDERRRKKVEKQIREFKGFDPNFYKATQLTIGHDLAKKYADDLKDSYGGIFTNDDEEKVYSILQSFKNKHNASLVSKYYVMRHNKALVDDVLDHMGSDTEVERISEIIKRY
jgi:hypothetical protein